MVYNKVIVRCDDVATIYYHYSQGNGNWNMHYIEKDGTVTQDTSAQYYINRWNEITVDSTHDYVALGFPSSANSRSMYFGLRQ